jgi:hypothetical protein
MKRPFIFIRSLRATYEPISFLRDWSTRRGCWLGERPICVRPLGSCKRKTTNGDVVYVGTGVGVDQGRVTGQSRELDSIAKHINQSFLVPIFVPFVADFTA